MMTYEGKSMMTYKEWAERASYVLGGDRFSKADLLSLATVFESAINEERQACVRAAEGLPDAPGTRIAEALRARGKP